MFDCGALIAIATAAAAAATPAAVQQAAALVSLRGRTACRLHARTGHTQHCYQHIAPTESGTSSPFCCQPGTVPIQTWGLGGTTTCSMDLKQDFMLVVVRTRRRVQVANTSASSDRVIFPLLAAIRLACCFVAAWKVTKLQCRLFKALIRCIQRLQETRNRVCYTAKQHAAEHT